MSKFIDKEKKCSRSKKIYIILIAAGFLLAACGGQGASDTGEVKITLTDFKAGVPYHFVVTNEGLINHEIMILPPAMGDMMDMDMGELDEMA